MHQKTGEQKQNENVAPTTVQYITAALQHSPANLLGMPLQVLVKTNI